MLHGEKYGRINPNLYISEIKYFTLLSLLHLHSHSVRAGGGQTLCSGAKYIEGSLSWKPFGEDITSETGNQVTLKLDVSFPVVPIMKKV